MKSKLFTILTGILIAIGSESLCQQQDNTRDTVFYHQNGKKSSEGFMRNGKPDGYWKTYNESGVLVSEGNRKDFELDSLWKFYNDEGRLFMEIYYSAGKKNGIRSTYSEEEIIREPFVDDVKQGLATTYFPDGSIKRTVYFRDGLEDGFAKEYNKDGLVITLIEYKKGFLIGREMINRTDKEGRKQGKWKYFHENGKIKLEGTYKNDLMDGYFKEYDKNGRLITVSKYINGDKQEDAKEISKLEVRRDYYPNGQLRIVGYYFNDIPQGVRREYNNEGIMEKGYVFNNGIIVGRGITDETGLKQGEWKEYYSDGKLMAEGLYKDNVRTGKWKFYHRNGALEQEGIFNKAGKHDGIWKWYYDTGELWKEESYRNGILDGMLTEYATDGKVILQGELIDGLEEGKWVYSMGDFREEGNYLNGKKDGAWKYFFSNGELCFEGKFIEDNANGKHTWYWENGKRKDEGFYIMGKREGDWTRYDEEGMPYLVVTYKNGIEMRYDGVKIVPELNEQDQRE